VALGALAIVPVVGVSAAPDAALPTPLHLHAASLRQDGRVLVLALATSRPWSPASLRRERRSLCLRLVSTTRAFATRDVCVARGGAAARFTYQRVLRAGGHGPPHPLAASVTRPDARSVTARFDPASIGVPYAPLRWRALSGAGGCTAGTAAAPCVDALPPAAAALDLRPPLPIGCTASGPGGYVRHVAGRGRVVALTFDDGPWTDTPAFVGLLERERVPATFFMIGRQVAGHGGLIRRMLGDGDDVGDHTWDHANVAGGGAFAAGEIGSTASAIQRASGFRPCLFRPPYGAVGPALTRVAARLGFATIGWDVDPSDWATPGTPAIESRVLSGVTAGSIVLMHDGGGPREQTLAALPHVIGVLRARGYRFLTVAGLTGATLRY
jgi:peptidoglycan/xylan/chitin deacetylase (PgdA/CDA1 family)